MMVILKPFIDHVQALDNRIHQLSEHLAQTDSGLEDANARLDATKASLADLRDGVVDRTNTRVQKLHEAIERCVQNHECLNSEHDGSKGHIRNLQNMMQVAATTQPAMQRSIIKLEEDMQETRTSLGRTNEDIETTIRRSMNLMGADLQDLKKKEGKSSEDLQRIQADLVQKGAFLKETREVLDKTVVGASGLQRQFQEMVQREAQMGARVEGWKHQWSKINPALDALRKEAAFLKQRSEHHDSVVHGLQQGYATTFSAVEALDGKQGRLRGDFETLRGHLTSAQKGLDDTRVELGKATSFSNNLHTVLERTIDDLSKTATKLDGLESRHTALTSHVEATTGNLADLTRNHHSSAVDIQNLSQELRRTNDTLSNARNQLEATGAGLQGVRSELGRTNDAVQRLDHGVELCHAGFSGLQKGIQETGHHMSTRPITLPKLPPGNSSMRSPRHNHDQSMSTMSASTTAASWRSP